MLWEDWIVARHRRGYMTVDIDLDAALDEIDDATLLDEVKTRKLSLGRDDFDPVQDMLDIQAALLRGHPAEALAILERLIRPKWNSDKACEMDLAASRNRASPADQS